MSTTDHEILARYPARAADQLAERSGDDRTVQWYAVRTATRREHQAAGALADAEFTTYLPVATRWGKVGRCGGQPKRIDYPLIPGYLFVLCTLDDLASVTAVDCVHTLVCATFADGDSHPIPFPLKDIIGLQAEEAGGLYDHTRGERPKYRPKKGDRVRVIVGTYLTFIGRVLATPKGERVHVMLEGPGGRGKDFLAHEIEAADAA